MSKRLEVDFAGIKFKNPIVLASGTCGFGMELNEYFDVNRLGGLSSKGLTLNPRLGNSGMRIYETASGIMNSVGLENPGVNNFIKDYLPWINSKDFVNIVNLGGHCMEDYLEGLKLLNECNIDILELNISCPNVKAGGMNFGVKAEVAREVVREARAICKHKLMVKLSPNAENIVELAKVCEEEGADAISLVNTFLGMAIDIKSKKPIFDNIYAGLSGPAIKPIALRMTHQVAKAVKIPIMAMGGITTYEDVLEFMMAGASAVQIGTATFMKPDISIDIINQLEKYLETNNIDNISELIGII